MAPCVVFSRDKKGDPISPLLFVICMEYLSRVLKEVAAYKFKCFQGCGELKLCHM